MPHGVTVYRSLPWSIAQLRAKTAETQCQNVKVDRLEMLKIALISETAVRRAQIRLSISTRWIRNSAIYDTSETFANGYTQLW